MLSTMRTLLRKWRESDREPFSKMGSDPKVMEFFSKKLDRKESDALVDKIETHFEKNGFGLWALEIPNVTEFAGFVGLWRTSFEAAFTPCVEIGWRIACEYWGKGYVTEAAKEVLRYGFDTLELDEVLAFTVPTNLRSRRVMERIGMNYCEGRDFEHPLVPEGHGYRRHVLYRIGRAE